MSYVADDNSRLFDSGGSLTEDLRFAFLIFSLVPFLGILFSIPTISMYLVSVFSKGRSLDKKLITAAILIFGIQIALWWLLYLAPKLAVSAV